MDLRMVGLLLLVLTLQLQTVSCPRLLPDEQDTTSRDLVRKDAASPPPPLPESSCCENFTIICTPSTDSSYIIPWITSFVSIVLCFVPGIRIWKLRPEHQGQKHTLFYWSVYIALYDSILWTAYTWTCNYFDPITITSIAAAIINLVLIIAATCKLRRHPEERRKVWFVCILPNLAQVFILPYQLLGWLAFGFAIVSHFLRIGATDYGRFNFILFVASVVGSVSGFLWLLHPNLCIAKQFKLASYVIACLRGLEAFLWSAPTIADVLQDLEYRSKGGRAE